MYLKINNLQKLSLLFVFIFSILLIISCSKEEQKEETTSPEKKAEKTTSVKMPEDAEIVKGIEIGKKGDALIVSSLGLPKTFNPILAGETSSTDVLGAMFYGLIGMDNVTQKIVSGLAKKWDRSEDGLTWTFYLRKGILWSDGVPFTADDVIFTYNDIVYNPAIVNDLGQILMVDEKKFLVEKIDDYTIKVKLPQIYAPFLDMFGSVPIVPKHKLETIVKEGKFDSAWSLDCKPNDIVVTGPYMMEKFEPDQKVVLVRNPQYWRYDEQQQQLPYIDRIIFVEVPDLDTMTLKFQNGESDVLTDISPANYMSVKDDAQKKDYSVYDLGPQLGQLFFWFNLNGDINKETNKPFCDPIKYSWFTNIKFRKALACAVDKKGIIDSVFSGRATPQVSILTPTNKLWYNGNVVKYEYDLNKAKAILDEIGFVDKNKDGIREDAKGNPISFSITSNKGNSNREKICVILQSTFKEIGIDLKVELVDFNAFVTRIDKSYDYDAGLIGFTGGIEPVGMFNMLKSNGQSHFWWPLQDKPKSDWEARIDELSNLNLKTYDQVERKKYFDEIQYIMSDQIPMIHLVTQTTYVGFSNKFGNVKPTILRHSTLWNIDEIYKK